MILQLCLEYGAIKMLLILSNLETGPCSSQSRPTQLSRTHNCTTGAASTAWQLASTRSAQKGSPGKRSTEHKLRKKSAGNPKSSDLIASLKRCRIYPASCFFYFAVEKSSLVFVASTVKEMSKQMPNFYETHNRPVLMKKAHHSDFLAGFPAHLLFPVQTL